MFSAIVPTIQAGQMMYTKEHLLQLVQITMPFGKYQGKRICDIPEEYLLWMQKKGFPQGHLGVLLAMMLEIRIHGVEDVLQPLKKAHQAKLIQPEAKGTH